LYLSIDIIDRYSIYYSVTVLTIHWPIQSIIDIYRWHSVFIIHWHVHSDTYSLSLTDPVRYWHYIDLIHWSMPVIILFYDIIIDIRYCDPDIYYSVMTFHWWHWWNTVTAERKSFSIVWLLFYWLSLMWYLLLTDWWLFLMISIGYWLTIHCQYSMTLSEKYWYWEAIVIDWRM